MLEGAAALGVVLHHAAQKTCAPWRPSYTIVHGLEITMEGSIQIIEPETGYGIVSISGGEREKRLKFLK